MRSRRRQLRRQRPIPETQEASAPSPLRYALFDMQPWEYDIVVCHGGTHDDLERLLRERFKVHDLDMDGVAGALGITFRRNSGIYVWTHMLVDLPVLVHELVHAITWMLERRGLTLSTDSEEAYAYTMSNILRRIIRHGRWETLQAECSSAR